jgi:hypothetical protein
VRQRSKEVAASGRAGHASPNLFALA